MQEVSSLSLWVRFIYVLEIVHNDILLRTMYYRVILKQVRFLLHNKNKGGE